MELNKEFTRKENNWHSQTVSHVFSQVTSNPHGLDSQQALKRFNTFGPNKLAEGHYNVDGRPIVMSDIRIPIFAVATTKDHVSPWRSVYKIHLLAGTEVTFLLTNGGHNAGIVSEPGHKGRQYQVTTRKHEAKYLDPNIWQKETPIKKGVWWPEWVRWLENSSENNTTPPPMGNPRAGYKPLMDAPGQYVLER